MLDHVLKGTNLTLSRNTCHELCSDFQMDKSYRLPYQNVHTHSEKPFDIIHIDVWVLHPNGMRYFLLFVVHYSIYQCLLCYA